MFVGAFGPYVPLSVTFGLTFAGHLLWLRPNTIKSDR
jgi:hypothetical protein